MIQFMLFIAMACYFMPHEILPFENIIA